MEGHIRAALGSGLAVAIIAGWSCAASAANQRTGAINKFSGVDEIVEACTTAQAFNNIAQMSRTFTVTAPASSVVVTFSAAARISGVQFDTGFIRLRIDSTTVPPGEIPFVGLDESGAQSFTWQTAPISGSHTARVQWRTDLGSQFCVDARALTILFK